MQMHQRDCLQRWHTSGLSPAEDSASSATNPTQNPFHSDPSFPFLPFSSLRSPISKIKVLARKPLVPGAGTCVKSNPLENPKQAHGLAYYKKTKDIIITMETKYIG